jgi:hypothetical protein
MGIAAIRRAFDLFDACLVHRGEKGNLVFELAGVDPA